MGEWLDFNGGKLGSYHFVKCSNCECIGYLDFQFCPHCGTRMINATGAARARQRKPQTNADRIRAMSDEELAKFFAQQKYRKPVFDGWLPLCYHVMGPRRCHEDGCEKCWLDWLKQEAET